MYNIFQANDTIKQQICKTLDLDSSDLFFASPLYFTAFFYLQKRFGDYFILDKHKDAAVWGFKVKYYNIQIILSSNNVTFLVFGPKKYVPKYPLWAKIHRMSKKGLYTNPSIFFDKEAWKPIFKKHLEGQNINYLEATQEHLDCFCELVQQESTTVIKEQRGRYKDEDYSNAYTRHALRTFDQFLKNMLTPIWVQDVGYNIKGRCGWDGGQYEDNIEIIKTEPPTPKESLQVQK